MSRYSLKRERIVAAVLVLLCAFSYINQGNNIVNNVVRTVISAPYRLFEPSQISTNSTYKSVENGRDDASQKLAENLGAASKSAKVVRRVISPLHRQIAINIGSVDGVKEGFYVVHQGELVGTITKVEPHLSWIALMSDPNYRVAVTIDGVNGQAIVKGNTNSIVVDRIPPTENLSGRSVATYGGDESKLAGVVVGVLGEESLQTGDSFLKRFQLNKSIREEYVQAVTVLEAK